MVVAMAAGVWQGLRLGHALLLAGVVVLVRGAWLSPLGKAGLAADVCFACPDRELAVEVLEDRLVPGDVVLVKGSRGMALEELVHDLDNEATATLQ